MTDSFWNLEEIQEIFDENTEAIINRFELERVGDRLKSKGYKLLNVSEFKKPLAIAVDPSLRRSFPPLELQDKLGSLANEAIAVLEMSFRDSSVNEVKVQTALEILRIVFIT